MTSETAPRIIGLWMSDKKSQKLNWNELRKACDAHGYNIIKIDLEKALEEQSQFDVFLHKLTDIIAASDQGDKKASSIIARVEQYLSNHPQITVVDPLDNVRILLNRNRYYSILHDESSFKGQGIFTPSFAELKTDDVEKNLEILRQHNVKFPVICKHTVAHGSKSSHNMILIFNEKDLSVCKPPCVVQSFVNHNAVLHKIFLVGNRYYICQRPSLKNFYASEKLEPIFYTTGEVCKADSQSTLSILDPSDKSNLEMNLDEAKIEHIIRVFREKINLTLAGLDIVIDNVTGDHAVIDINVFPSYDNFPNFFEHLLDTIDNMSNSEVNGDIVGDASISNGTMNGLVNIAMCRCENGVKGFSPVALVAKGLIVIRIGADKNRTEFVRHSLMYKVKTKRDPLHLI